MCLRIDGCSILPFKNLFTLNAIFYEYGKIRHANSVFFNVFVKGDKEAVL